ncbi:hypothetical protein BMF94_3730 [Rhodotorula taiwanensis]|uniref:Peptidase M3A/M3B catalytic domain-containing protein n=1 Tax=Rhodotorula taiwanensis TaxID=741276 RepID=A0A2S5B9E4_9BASI|nr:hypothetical protein BMF94_3730 [Rhodotorula taiwanensis]
MLAVRSACTKSTRTLTRALSAHPLARSALIRSTASSRRPASFSSPTLSLRSLEPHRLRAFATAARYTMPSYPRAPVLPPRWADYTPEHIPALTNKTLAEFDTFLDQLVATPRGQRTFESIVEPLALRSAECDRTLEPALFLQYVSTEKDIRDASVEADKVVQAWSVDMVGREDVYEALLDAQKHVEGDATTVQLNPEQKRLLDRMVLERKRNGLGLDKENRTKFQELKKRIMALEVDFQRACNEEKGFMLFTKEELEGVPEDVISGFATVEEGGATKYKVTHKTPDVSPLFKYAIQPATRKRANLSYENKTIENAPVLSEITKLRDEAAKLLGYKNHAEWVLEVKMAKTPAEVMSFLEDLETKLRPLGFKEREELLELKRAEHEKRGLPADERFNLWDYRYYDRLFVEKTLDLDDNLVKEYFPVAKVVPTVLDIYKDLLGIELVAVPREEAHGGITWHDECELYAVWENGQAQSGNQDAFLGYMFLDLQPRENKYGHAAVWGLIPGWTDPNKGRQFPTVCMVANLAKPTPGRPATMKHDDVVTLFHELGHAFHGLCSKTQYARFHGTAVSRDFVEAPSQMNENFVWTPSIIKRISSHYEREGETLPDDLIEKLIKSRKLGQGLFNLRQLFFGKYDMALHTDKYNLSPDEMSKLWCDLREETSLVTIGDEVVGGQSGFAHIAGGYSAGYYGYLYSQVFSTDMYATVFEKDPMDAGAGQRYRREILQPGGSRDEMDSLVAFLGRKPTNDAFLKSLLG